MSKQHSASRAALAVYESREAVAQQIRINQGRIADPIKVKRILSQQQLSEFYRTLQSRRAHKLSPSSEAPTQSAQ